MKFEGRRSLLLADSQMQFLLTPLTQSLIRGRSSSRPGHLTGCRGKNWPVVPLPHPREEDTIRWLCPDAEILSTRQCLFRVIGTVDRGWGEVKCSPPLRGALDGLCSEPKAKPRHLMANNAKNIPTPSGTNKDKPP